jgi:hypothetical protein
MTIVFRLTRRAHILTLALVVGLILAAEVLRESHQRQATLLSMLAWSLFFVAFLNWVWVGRGWRSALQELGKIGVLSLIAGSVLLLYYVRSRTLEAGVHVDAAYTYIGLTWFTELRNPITFAAGNPSYHQFPMMLLAHLPALAIGFGRLGAFSCHLGTMLQVSLLLAVMTTIFVPQRLTVQALTVGLVAAVFSNRMLVLSYNNFGYTVPAICLGLMFLVVVDDESVPDPDRIVGGLLSLSLLHHYSAFTHVLPLSLVWLLARRGALRRLRVFLAKNSVLLAVGAILLITLAIRPELIMTRIKHVTIRPDADFWQPLTLQDLATKIRQNWSYLVSMFPRSWFRLFVVKSPGTWSFLNIPPLGGLVVPVVAGTWILSAWSLLGRRLRYLLYLLSFASALLALAVMQHLVTDFAEYRDLLPIFALMVAGLLFVFRAPRLGLGLKLAAVSCAVAVAVFNYVDLAKLHGKIHGTSDYAHLSQQTMEGLAQFLKRRSPEEIGVARIHVVLDSFFPLGSFYLKDLERYAVPIHVIDAKDFCADQGRTVEAASSMACDAFLLVTHSKRCPAPAAADGEGLSRVRGYVHSSICGRLEAGLLDRSKALITIDPEDPSIP